MPKARPQIATARKRRQQSANIGLPTPSPYKAARIDSKKLRLLLSGVGVQPRNGHFTRFRTCVESALTRFIIATANTTLLIKPSALTADLDRIEQAATDLADLFIRLREAEDAMVRVAFPHVYKADPSIIFGPPEFVIRMFEIAATARAAKVEASRAKPYVRVGRGKHAVNSLIECLIATWNECFEEKATFSVDSPFVKLTAGCLKLVGAPLQSLDALAQQCRRIARKRRPKLQ